MSSNGIHKNDGTDAGNGVHGWFRTFAQHASTMVGSPWAFAIAALVVVAWAITGPIFGFSDSWQLVINTGTTIVTFLMVFLIQNTQNRDARAMQLKLDELIRAVHGARNDLVDLEELSDEELDQLQKQFQSLRQSAGDKRPTHQVIERAQRHVDAERQERKKN